MRKWRVTAWYRGAVLEEYTTAKTEAQAKNFVRYRLRNRGVYVLGLQLEAEEMP